MNFDFMLRASCVALICVLAQLAVRSVVRRFRVKTGGGAVSQNYKAEELRWAIATVIVILLLALMGEAVWHRWRARRATRLPAVSARQLPLTDLSTRLRSRAGVVKPS